MRRHSSYLANHSLHTLVRGGHLQDQTPCERASPDADLVLVNFFQGLHIGNGVLEIGHLESRDDFLTRLTWCRITRSPGTVVIDQGSYGKVGYKSLADIIEPEVLEGGESINEDDTWQLGCGAGRWSVQPTAESHAVVGLELDVFARHND